MFQIARIDKVVQIVRATAGTTLTGLLGVTVNAGGSVVPSGAADADGVVCLPGTIAAGKPVGVLVAGEIVEFGGVAGTDYYAGAAGAVTTTATGRRIGFTVEGDRLVVRV